MGEAVPEADPVAMVGGVVMPLAPAPPSGQSGQEQAGLDLLAVVAGANVLVRVVDQPRLVLCWVVLVVGAHVVPVATAFGAPVFTVVGSALVVVGLGGGAGVLAGAADAEHWCGVVAGVVLLAAAAWGAVGTGQDAWPRGRRTAQERSRE